MSDVLIVQEKYPARVSAEFTNEADAGRAAQSLIDDGGFQREQIKLIAPRDPHLERKLEPETRAIGGKLVTHHVKWGGAALLLSLALAWLLVHMGPSATQSNPLLTYLALIIICPILALIMAGMITIRPDHDHIINKARRARDSGRWTVVALCADADQKDRAKGTMGYTAQTL